MARLRKRGVNNVICFSPFILAHIMSCILQINVRENRGGIQVRTIQRQKRYSAQDTDRRQTKQKTQFRSLTVRIIVP